MISLPDHEPAVASDAADDATRPLSAARRSLPAPRPKVYWPLHDLALVAVSVLLILAAAATYWQTAAHDRARERLIADFTSAQEAFLTYLQVHGTAPADAPPGELPPGMQPAMLKFDWTSPSALGGHFRWTPLPPSTTPVDTPTKPPAPLGGTLTLTAFPSSPSLQLTPADLLELDRRLDDGDLTTGQFRRGFNGWPVLTVQVRR